MVPSELTSESSTQLAISFLSTSTSTVVEARRLARLSNPDPDSGKAIERGSGGDRESRRKRPLQCVGGLLIKGVVEKGV